MNPIRNIMKLRRCSIFLGASLAILCLALAVQAQEADFDSEDADSDSDGSPVSRSELGKLARSSVKGSQGNQFYTPEATRNLYNRQNQLNAAPSYKRSSNEPGLSGYGVGSAFSGLGTAASNLGRGNQRNAGGEGSSGDDDDDREGSANFGPSGFGANFDNEGGSANGRSGSNSNADDDGEGPPMNLNQAASGYPNQGDYNNDAGFGAGFGFGGNSGPGGDGEDGSSLGPSDNFDDGRRAKSASSPSASRNPSYGMGLDDEASSVGGGALQYGPNSAVNSGERDPDDEGSSAYRGGAGNQGANDNDSDDD